MATRPHPQARTTEQASMARSQLHYRQPSRRTTSSSSSITTTAFPLLLAALLMGCCIAGTASGAGIFEGEVKMACPRIHVLAARETTAPPGFGTSADLVDLILAANLTGPVTAQAISYPAQGGGNYTASVGAGVVAVLSQLSFFHLQCPDAMVVMHGYSQGGQIIDDAFCGGPDGESLADLQDLIRPEIGRNVAAIVLMGNPRHNVGISFNVGNATEPGFASRAVNFTCPEFGDRIQSYCDSPDPFCAKGDDAVHHQQYGKIYGQHALHFVLQKLAELVRSRQEERV